MRSRKFTKRIEIWEDVKTPDGFGGNTVLETLRASSWANVQTTGVNSKFARNTNLGVTEGTFSIIIHTRKRKDLVYNISTQFIKYRGEKYIIQNEPINVDFEDSIIEIVATKLVNV
jgi:hypothetical protein